MSAETDAWTLITIALLTANTVVTRCFFFISSKRWSLPGWARRSLNYAPIAALAAVIVPEIVMSNGQLIDTWRDARLFAVAVGTAYFFWKRGILGTILSGTAVMLILRIGLGW